MIWFFKAYFHLRYFLFGIYAVFHLNMTFYRKTHYIDMLNAALTPVGYTLRSSLVVTPLLFSIVCTLVDLFSLRMRAQAWSKLYNRVKQTNKTKRVFWKLSQILTGVTSRALGQLHPYKKKKRQQLQRYKQQQQQKHFEKDLSIFSPNIAMWDENNLAHWWHGKLLLGEGEDGSWPLCSNFRFFFTFNNFISWWPLPRWSPRLFYGLSIRLIPYFYFKLLHFYLYTWYASFYPAFSYGHYIVIKIK